MHLKREKNICTWLTLAIHSIDDHIYSLSRGDYTRLSSLAVVVYTRWCCLWAFVICLKNTNGPAATTLDVNLRMLMICQLKQAQHSRWSELRNNLGTV